MSINRVRASNDMEAVEKLISDAAPDQITINPSRSREIFAAAYDEAQEARRGGETDRQSHRLPVRTLVPGIIFVGACACMFLTASVASDKVFDNHFRTKSASIEVSNSSHVPCLSKTNNLVSDIQLSQTSSRNHVAAVTLRTKNPGWKLPPASPENKEMATFAVFTTVFSYDGASGPQYEEESHTKRPYMYIRVSESVDPASVNDKTTEMLKGTCDLDLRGNTSSPECSKVIEPYSLVNANSFQSGNSCASPYDEHLSANLLIGLPTALLLQSTADIP